MYLNMTLQELFGIIGAVGIVVFIVIVFVLLKAYCASVGRRDKPDGHNKCKDSIAGKAVRPPDLTEFERASKISNLDLNIVSY